MPGSTVLAVPLLGSLTTWHRPLGALLTLPTSTPRAERFHEGTIMSSQTREMTPGDSMANDPGFAYVGSAARFGALLVVTAGAYY